MSIGYTCIMDKKLVVSVWDGNVTLDQWRENLDRLLADPDFPATRINIVDMRFGHPDHTIGEGEIQQVIDFLATHQEKIAGRKIAIVAGEDFTKPKYFERLAESLLAKVIVFNFLHSACSWLGADPKETEQTMEQIRVRLRHRQ